MSTPGKKLTLIFISYHHSHSVPERIDSVDTSRRGFYAVSEIFLFTDCQFFSEVGD